MKTFSIYKNLAHLNEIPAEEAETLLLSCSGSQLWAERMAEARPFAMLENLFATAETIWFSLPSAELLSAFAMAPVVVNDESELAEAARLYREKFGFIFVLSASEKGADEVLAICRARIGNSVETELEIAAEEQLKIIEIRLNSILEQ